MTLSFHAALFDMDGTLVDSTAIIEEEWRRWANAIGHDPDAVLQIAHGRRTEEVIGMIAPQRPIAAELAHFLKLAATVDPAKVAPVPGALAFVSALRPSDWAVVTSAPARIAQERLRLAGFPAPGVLISADDVRRGKPDPEGFLSAASRLQTLPADCLVFEDSPAGIQAGRAASMRVIALRTTHASLGFGEEWAVSTFADIGITRGESGYLVHLNTTF